MLLLRTLECKRTRVIREGRTAVHFAAEHDKPAIIEALFMMKADVNICDKYMCRVRLFGCLLWLQKLSMIMMTMAIMVMMLG